MIVGAAITHPDMYSVTSKRQSHTTAGTDVLAELMTGIAFRPTKRDACGDQFQAPCVLTYLGICSGKVLSLLGAAETTSDMLIHQL